MGEHTCSTELIAKAVREYEGVRRKSEIGAIVNDLKLDCPGVIASFGEDAAVIQNNGDALLLAADGIWSKLMDADPYWAGYCAVLVNIHDIAAMGGRPLAMVDVFSISSGSIRDAVIAGMRDASAQFGVPIVGGHLHPETPYSVIDIAILGVAPINGIIYSSTAQAGDLIVVAIDLEGRVHPSCALNWDSATLRTAEEVRAQIHVLEELGTRQLVTAGKDISNPGIIGTLGMLLEVSGMGGRVDLSAIPRPDECHNIPFEQWVRMYPGMGFVLTLREKHREEVSALFSAVGMTAQVIGEVNDSKVLRIVYNDEDTSVFDFTSDNGITNLGAEERCPRIS
ncbi:MAG TPA: methanogenesis marker 2 protein [Methanospirillum sp.]|uniref:methanogenesis marker 2 protein n=1 Tax=Methanospirillum sp. TaxID=45200 RepID=UPI002CB48779|nr:methanogenesis marker 2 protein [Methanospirillum sp.]HWQ62804.1 methanogenesis marker 2 protein [Methanospirillum sp.]